MMPGRTRECGLDPAAVLEALLANGGSLHAVTAKGTLEPLSRDAALARPFTEMVRLPE